MQQKKNSKEIINLVISKTIIFIFATIVVVAFKFAFGENNSYIGVSTFIAMLMYLERDLTKHFIKNTIGFVVINLAMGIGVIAIQSNMWTGIPINLVLVFVIGYTFCHDLKRPVYIAFILQYVFLLSFPVPYSQQGSRLLALVVGGIVIMIPQVLNINKIKKSSMKNFINLSSLINQKGKKIFCGEDSLNLDEDSLNLDKEINRLFSGTKIIILDGRDRDFYITKDGKGSIVFLAALENIYFSLCNKKSLSEELLKCLNEYFVIFNELLEKKMSIESFKKLTIELIDKYKEELVADEKNIQILCAFETINKSLKRDHNSKGEAGHGTEKLPKKFKGIKTFIQDNKDSVAFSYAIRVSIGMTITCFLTQFFDLKEGQWMLFTIFSLVNPLYETSKYKSKDRFISTILGAIVTIILLSIFKTSAERTIILLLIGYTLCYMEQYKYMLFFATICIITMATGTSGVFEYALERIGFVIIGSIFAIILNRFVLRRDLEKQNLILKNRYKNIITEMITEVYNSCGSKVLNDNKMNNLFLTISLIKRRIEENCKDALVNFNEVIDIREEVIINSIYNLYVELEKNKNNDEYLKFLQFNISELEKTIKVSKNLKELEKKMIDEKNIERKIIYSNLYNISYLYKN